MASPGYSLEEKKIREIKIHFKIYLILQYILSFKKFREIVILKVFHEERKSITMFLFLFILIKSGML